MATDSPRRLQRSRSQKLISGVCGGLGAYLDVDPVLVRLAFVVVTAFSGVGILAYAALWVLMPVEGEASTRADAIRHDLGRALDRIRDLIDPPNRSGASGHQAGPAAGMPTATA